MATYDRDLQAAVDATSVARDAGTAEDLQDYLRQQLAERDIETTDDAWLAYVVEQIRADPNYMVDREPEDFERSRDR
jgi:DNA-directed RNA polymerase specialized sigma54-like protein